MLQALASRTHPVRRACLLAKGPVVHARAALLALARHKGVRYLHESAVMDGVPLGVGLGLGLGHALVTA